MRELVVEQSIDAGCNRHAKSNPSSQQIELSCCLMVKLPVSTTTGCHRILYRRSYLFRGITQQDSPARRLDELNPAHQKRG